MGIIGLYIHPPQRATQSRILIPLKKPKAMLTREQTYFIKRREKMASDKEIIEAIATLWISLGGDKEGFEWCQDKIAKEIERKGKQSPKSPDLIMAGCEEGENYAT